MGPAEDVENEGGKKMGPAEDVSFSALGNWGETKAATGAGDKSQEGFSVQQRYKNSSIFKIATCPPAPPSPSHLQ